MVICTDFLLSSATFIFRPVLTASISPRVLTSYIFSPVLTSYIFSSELTAHLFTPVHPISPPPTGKDELSVLSGKYTMSVLGGNMMYILGEKYGLSSGVKI